MFKPEEELAKAKQEACENPESFLSKYYDKESMALIKKKCKVAGIPLRVMIEFRCKLDTVVHSAVRSEMDTWIRANGGIDPKKHIAMRLLFGLMAAQSMEMHFAGYSHLTSVLATGAEASSLDELISFLERKADE
jgi:acyl-CoA thioesterase